ncbi:MAG: helicase C-terminal domain-containing protein, partial [Halioglobus sp.]
LLERNVALKDLFFDVLQCLRVVEEWGPEYRLQLTRSEQPQSLVVHFNCLDPARLLALRQAKAHAVTAFSATLSPLAWMRGRIGLADDAVCTRAVSPFAARQLQVHLATHIDTRFTARERTLSQLASLLGDWLATNPGNCIIYFPSYRYLSDCHALLEQQSHAHRLWVQQREADEGQRQALLEQLAASRDTAALCILGGVFGEGIDLPGEQLRSVVVVGVGMPQVNRETRELQAWYQRTTGAGFEHAFLFPGMQKVDQALGRVVRRMEDSGSALLIDARYARPEYRDLLPPWWEYLPWRQAARTS